MFRLHGRGGARSLDIGLGLEQVHQEAAAIEALLRRGAAPLVGRTEQLMGAVDHVVDGSRLEALQRRAEAGAGLKIGRCR